MDIYIETYSIAHPYVGVGEFCLNLGKQLALHAHELHCKYGIKLHFIVPSGKEGIFGRDVRYLVFPADFKLFSQLYTRHIDLLHLPHQYCRFKHFPNVDYRLMTIHDINFMYEKQGDKLERYKRKFEHKCGHVDYISYISNFTKQDTERNFQITNPSRVIYNGVTKLDVLPVKVSGRFKRKLPKEPFLFHISSLRPKKNVHLLIEMMAHLPGLQLVIAGDWRSRYGLEMQRKISELGLKNVVCLNNVSTDEKAWLYAHCKAFLFPSECEGFGLPPVEAMCFGKPVFLSELTSLPEIGGESAFYWPDLTPQAMAQLVEEKLAAAEGDAALPAALKANTDRFDWEQCAQEYIQYYLDILQMQKGRTIDDRNRPVVSVVTVCRNDAEGLAKTIDSVVSQTYEKKEYIVVDGASTDATVDVLQANKAHFDRWVSEPDRGIYDAMNKAVRMASGEWVIFMNAGDTFAADDVLERIFEKSRASDIIYGDVIKLRNDGTPYVYPAEAVHESHRMFFCHQSSLVRRQRLLDHPFDIRHTYSADFKFFKEMLHEQRLFSQLPYPIAFFNTDGVSNTHRAAGLYDNIRVIHEVDRWPVRLRLLPRLWFQWGMSQLRKVVRH